MADDISSGRNGDEIIFHFDVASHSIPIKQFVDTARSSQMVIDDFNERIFDNKLRYELRIRTSEVGGFIEILWLTVLSGGGILWSVLGTDIGKAYIKGLTGEEPAFWAEHFGRKTKTVLGRLNKTQSEPEKSDPDIKSAVLSLEDSNIEAEIIILMVRSFLERNVDNLERIGFTPTKFRKAYEARNTIYKACLDNPEVKGLSFDRSHSFPLKRRDFPRQIAHIPDKEEAEEKQQSAWTVDTVDIVVNSPNWKKDGRKWQAATSKYQDISFTIEDDTFWHHVEIKDIQPDIKDNMQVQWAYPAGLSKPSQQVRVLKVLSYNGKRISEPLSEDALKHILEEPFLVEDDSLDLFTDSPRQE